MTAPLYTFYVKDGGTIRDDMLRTLRNMLVNRGVPSPNMTPGSDYYALAQAVAGEVAVGMMNCQTMVDQLMPDTAQGAQLDRVATIVGLSRRKPGGSLGFVINSTSSPTVIITGANLLDNTGLRYQVTTGGTYGNGDLIPIAAIDTGAATNLVTAALLRWTTPPPFCATTVSVSSPGLANGSDAEDDESFRYRIYARFQNFPAAGNWAYAATLATQSYPSVQGAAVYPAIQGPATFHVAVWAAPTATNKNRDLAASTVNGIVGPYIQGQYPEHAFSLITTVTNTPVDVAIGLALPAATTASPPGAGGGWIDGTPWPASVNAGALVLSVASSTQFTINAQVPPTPGVTHISWISPINWQTYTAIVTQPATGSSGAYTVTIDTPFIGLAAGNLIFPQSANQANYVAAILGAFALMGPGEKSTNASALIRGFRHPLPNAAWQYSVGPTMLRAMTNSGTEVFDAQFYLRYDGTTTLTTNTGLLTPQVPGVVTGNPLIYTPRNLAFYPI